MIHLGYEIGTGKRVSIPLNHMAVVGQTQVSGKTTTLEALVERSGLKAIAFITKPGEKSFRLQHPIPAFFSESTVDDYWKYVQAIVENVMQVKLGWQERGWIVKLCQDYQREGKTKAQSYKWKRPKTLEELLANVEIALPHLRGTPEMICIQLREYLKPAVREISRTEFTSKLELEPGINVMDITELSDGLKTLVIRSVIEWVHKKCRRVVVIIPEAWKFIPEGRGTPVKLALEGLIREGGGVENFVWMDSQDLRGVDKLLLRSVIVWLFGVQRQRNEVANTLDSIPDHPKPSASEIMQLGKGQFYVCYSTTLVRTYVQPAGMEDEHAKAISLGDEEPESWSSIVRGLDKAEPQSGAGSMDGRATAFVDGDRRDQGSDGDQTLQEEASSLPAAEEDEAMWKEKYEALKAEFDELKEAHDELAKRLRGAEVAVRDFELGSAAAYPVAPGFPVSTASLSKQFQNGDLDALYRYILGRAAKEDPKTLRALMERPELVVEVKRQTIEANGSTLRGALAILFSEKYFDAVREFSDV